MAIDLHAAAKRLIDGYLGGTLSGEPILESAAHFVEMYHFTFMWKLQGIGVESEEALSDLLSQVIEIEHVGDVTGCESPDVGMTCAMGLVLLDRIAQTGWGKRDFERCFLLHEQLFECLEAIMDTEKRVKQARRAASKRSEKTNLARDWIRSEWKKNSAGYGGNKSDFARTYVALIKERFKDNKDDPLVVTEKTIREVWLANTPTAS